MKKNKFAILKNDFIPESEHWETGYWNIKKGTKVVITSNDENGLCNIEYLDATFTINCSFLTPIP